MSLPTNVGMADQTNIARFKSYHDYLDSLIAEEDIRYLQECSASSKVTLVWSAVQLCSLQCICRTGSWRA